MIPQWLQTCCYIVRTKNANNQRHQSPYLTFDAEMVCPPWKSGRWLEKTTKRESRPRRVRIRCGPSRRIGAKSFPSTVHRPPRLSVSTIGGQANTYEPRYVLVLTSRRPHSLNTFGCNESTIVDKARMSGHPALFVPFASTRCYLPPMLTYEFQLP